MNYVKWITFIFGSQLLLGLLIEHSKVYGESLEELEALGRQLLGGDDDDVATKGEILQDNIGDIEHLMKRFGGEVEDDNLIETTFKSREPSENKDSCKKMLAARNPSRCGIKTNGCGGQGMKFSYIPYNDTLVNACIKHDICYHCGKFKKWERKSGCDGAFYNDMKLLCDCKYRILDPSFIYRKLCKAAARTYYMAVYMVGGSFFNDELDKERCDGKCAVKEGSPELHVP